MNATPVAPQEIAGAELIRFCAVSKSFRGHDAPAHVLRHVSFDIRRGEVFGIVGPSGAGKSTLIRLINRLESPSSGEVLYNGENLASLSAQTLAEKRRKIGMIFQQFGLLASKTALQNVRYALDLAGTGTRDEREAKAAALLERVGLADHATKYPAQLSGGQKQRVAIARALANDPEVLLCDEATSALDPEATDDVLKLLAELNRDLHLTIVLVTHEMDVVRRACDRVAILSEGEVAEIGPVADVFLSPQSAAAKALSRRLLPQPPDDGNGHNRLRLIYFEDSTDASFLSDATRGLNASLRLLAGHVAELKSARFGHLIVDIDGAGRRDAITRLRNAGVRVEEIAR